MFVNSIGTQRSIAFWKAIDYVNADPQTYPNVKLNGIMRIIPFANDSASTLEEAVDLLDATKNPSLLGTIGPQAGSPLSILCRILLFFFSPLGFGSNKLHVIASYLCFHYCKKACSYRIWVFASFQREGGGAAQRTHLIPIPRIVAAA